MNSKSFVSVTDVIEQYFGKLRAPVQKFADYRGVGVTQVRRWIKRDAHIPGGDPGGKIFVMATAIK